MERAVSCLSTNLQQNLLRVRAVLGCPETELPVTYLGMPLSVKRPTRDAFVPIIDKTEKRLQGWKRKLISRGGRLQLVKSVLSSILIYFMCCFLLPKWVIARMDKIRRNFLSRKNDAHKKGISLINWAVVCLPKKWGGMGVINLHFQNICLLMRWWWTPYVEPQALWTVTVTKLHGTGNYANGPNFWAAKGSFFWNQLQKLKWWFDWSTKWVIGSGQGISFWYESWEGISLIHELQERPQYPYIFLHDAIPIIQLFAPDFSDKVEAVAITEARDVLVWRWTANGEYTVWSMYSTMMGAGLIRDQDAFLWKLTVPPTVKIFGFLLLKDSLLTHDNMLHRNMRCNSTCALCENCPVESSFHVFFLCPYAVHVWFILSNKAGFNLIQRGADIQKTWELSIRNLGSRGGDWKKRGTTLFLCTCWMTWKQRNAKKNSDERMPPQILADWIWHEAELWRKNC